MGGEATSRAARSSCEVLITTEPPPATVASNTRALAFEMLPVRCEYTLPETALLPDASVYVSLNGFEKDFGEDWTIVAPDTIRFRALEACEPGTRVVIAYSC